MLSAADAQFVRRDSALPGLATMLDPEAFAGALAPFMPAIDPGSARIEYVRYKPGKNCIVAYRVGVAGMDSGSPTAGRRYRPGERQRLRRAGVRDGPQGKDIRVTWAAPDCARAGGLGRLPRRVARVAFWSSLERTRPRSRDGSRGDRQNRCSARGAAQPATGGIGSPYTAGRRGHPLVPIRQPRLRTSPPLRAF